MEELIITYKTKYALLSQSDYLILNEKISEAMSFELGESTARYTNIVPDLCKTAITYVNEVETYTTMAVMQILAGVQINYPELLTGITLVDNFIPAEPATELTAVNLTSVTIDYTLNHIAAVGTTLEVIQLESAPRTAESDKAVNKLVGEGLTIITVE